MPSPGRLVSEMARMRHPADLRKRLPHDDPGAELQEVHASVRRGLPPGRRAVGLHQVDEMPHEPGVRRARVQIGYKSAPIRPVT